MKVFIPAASLAAMLIMGGAAANAQTPVIAAGGVLNGASFDKSGVPVSPGSLVSIFGTNLSAATASALSVPISTSLSSVSVTFNNVPAPLAFVSSDQINAQVPWDILPIIPPGTNGVTQIPVVVTRNGVPSAPVNVSVGAAAPGIFAYPGGQAVAYGNSDGAIAANGTPGLPTSHPAKIGDPTTLVILATGLGAVDTTVKNGDVPSVITSSTLVKPTVLIGNVPAQVVFSGLVGRDASGTAFGFVGVYQINVIIAAGTPTGDKVPIQIQMNGVTSPNTTTIAVSQ
jgi:uncharacterized protein (TIGR03437 family)